MSRPTSYQSERGPFQHTQAPSRAFHTGESVPSNASLTNLSSIATHDWRFPRRPDHDMLKRGANGPSSQHVLGHLTGSHAGHGSSKEPQQSHLSASIFPACNNGAAAEDLDDIDAMQEKDPLATQIWKLYAKTKKSLPNQERMENMTWRMMSITLSKKREEAERLVARIPKPCMCSVDA